MKNLLKLSLVSFSVLLLGAGCAPVGKPIDLPLTPPTANHDAANESATDTTMKKDKDIMMKKDGDKMMKPSLKPYYVAYSADGAKAALAEGRVTLLYFYAPWCPICRAEEPVVKANVEASGLPVAGFRVDYDTETALKSQYKIPYQHTTVILNTKGLESARFSGPMTKAELQTALADAAK